MRPRTWSLSSVLARVNDGSLHISKPAVVLVARQSKLGSERIAVRSSVAFSRHVLVDGRFWIEMLCLPNRSQLALLSLIQSAFSAIARGRFASRLSLSSIALLSLWEA